MTKKRIRTKPRPKPAKPLKPRNYEATDITRIQLHRIDADLLSLQGRVQKLEDQMAGGPVPTFEEPPAPAEPQE